MTDLSAILQCTYGTSTFQLETYTLKEDPILKAGVGRTGTRVSITCEGYAALDGTAAGYAADLAAVLADLRTDGRDFTVTEFGQQVYSLPAAVCAEGGPHIAFEMGDGDGMLRKAFKFSIATDKTDTGAAGPTDSYKIKIATRPDNLRIVTRAGEINGPASGDFFINKVLPSVSKAYDPRKWILSHEYETSSDPNAIRTSYTIQVVEVYGLLPKSAAGKDVAVEGEVTIKTDRDEQYRQTTTIDFNLLVIGDPQEVIKGIRQQAIDAGRGKNVILKESFAITQIKEQRISGSFHVLQAADPDRPYLLNWTETYSLDAGDRGWEIKEYPGCDPIAVKRPNGVPILTQSGSCVALKHYKEVAPVYPATLVEAPKRTYTYLNDIERGTSWSYKMYAALPGPSGNYETPNLSFDQSDLNFGSLLRSATDNNYLPKPPGEA